MPASIFAGSKVKTLKSTLSLNGGADIISSTTNPQISAVSAEPGSLLLNTTSGTMYRKLDAGSTTNWVEVGAGTGGKNYIKNPDFDGGATTSWSMQKVSLSNFIPTGNIGAADAGHTIAASSSSPLEGANSLLVQGASAFTAGNCLVSAAFTIDREDVAKVMGWSFAYEAITTNMDFSGTIANTWAVYIAEVTTATPNTVVSWIQPAGVYNLTQGSGVGLASGTFQTTATETSAYRLVLVCINSEAASTTLKVDDFQLGPQKVIQGPSGPVGEIISTGSLTPPVGFLYCDGSAVSRNQYSDLFLAIGTTYGTGDGATTFNLPDLRGVFARGAGTQTIGSVTYTRSLGTKQNDAFQGHYHSLATGGAGTVNSLKMTNGSGSFGAEIAAGNNGAELTRLEATQARTGLNGTPRIDSETRPANVSVAYHIRYLATYQMSNDTDTRVVAFYRRNDGATSTTITTSPTVITSLGNTFVDTHAAWDSTNNWYRIPVSGVYRITGSFFAGTISVANQSAICSILVDSVNAGDVGAENNNETVNVLSVTVNGSLVRFLNAGQVVQLAGRVGSGTAVAGQFNPTYLSIERLSGPATIASSETVAASYSTSAGPSIPNNSATIVVYPTRQFDTHGMMNTSTGLVTIPVSGKYLISAGHYFANAITATATDVQTICRKNGFTVQGTNIPKSGTGAGPLATQGTFTVQCNAGDTIGIFLLQANSASTAQPLLTDGNFNFMTITRVGN